MKRTVKVTVTVELIVGKDNTLRNADDDTVVARFNDSPGAMVNAAANAVVEEIAGNGFDLTFGTVQIEAVREFRCGLTESYRVPSAPHIIV